ncbi:MAG: protein kinase [Myxococcales bacterium]|nr:protein kinase [Myxococcales bacterium]
MPEPEPAVLHADRWATIAAQTQTLAGNPHRTIKPRDSRPPAPDQGIATPHGGLELGPVLGEGGMGVVRLAVQVAMGREVAVKAVQPARRGPGPTRKLLQEAWTAGRLEHPNIVPVYDITADDDGHPLIVLKRIEGESWSSFIAAPERAQDLLSVVDVLEWHLQVLVQVCHAIHFAHDRRVVHLDLKPDNVMIGRHGEVYVVDWGIALALEDDGSGRLPLAADHDEILGTPHYMAPEMLEGDGRRLDERTDVYLLGAVVFEVLAGRPPHQGEGLMEVLHAVVMEEPALPASVPRELAEICRRAMARDPAHRYPGAQPLREALQAFLRHRDSGRLAQQAQERVDELAAVLAGEGSDRSRHELFAQARFGFEQALASWPGNDQARQGLGRATALVVRYELEHGDPQVAATLAAEAPQLPAELAARVDQAVQRRRAGLEQLVELRCDQDLRLGQRTRAFVIAVLGTLWTVLPAQEHFRAPRPASAAYLAYAAAPATSLVLVLALAIWARESLGRTRVNRVVVSAIALAMTGQLALTAGCALLSVDPVHTVVLMPLVWSMVAAMVALTVEPRLGPVAIVFGLGFFAAAAWPSWRFLIVAACDLTFTIIVLAVWWPERLRGPIAEPDHRS